MMDPTFREMALRSLEQALPGIDLFSREFLFDRRHAADRSQLLTIAGPAGSMSRLSFLLREALPEARRRELFSGDYDLGNLWCLLPEFCTTGQPHSKNGAPSLVSELIVEWERERPSEERIIDASHLKKIKQDLAALTGRSMEDHYACNKSAALKVVKLLYRLGRDDSAPENAGAGRFQLFDWLKWPEGDGRHRFSLSFRSAYPYQSPTSNNPSFKTSEERSALLADLKGYLSVELDDETYAAIVGVPEELHWHLNSIGHNVEKLLVDMGRTGYGDAVKLYDYLSERMELLAFPVEDADIPLDEALFLYLHTLEFAHFADGYPKLLNKAEPDCTLVPVWQAINELARDSTKGALEMHNPIVPEDEFAHFVRNKESVLRLIVGAALREAITSADLAKTIEPARRLALAYAIFRKRALEGEQDRIFFSTLDVVAALCCVRHEQRKTAGERTRHKPFWKGQQAQGGSILSSLDLPVLGEQPFAFYDHVPEEHRLIWTSRLEWFLNALQDHTGLTVQRFRFARALMHKAKAIARTNNRAGMRDAMERLNLATFELGRHFLGG